MGKDKFYLTGFALTVVAVIGMLLTACQSTITVSSTPPAPTSLPSTEAPATSEVILTTGDWPPYVFETGPNQGPMAEIVIAAFKEAGITTKVIFYPWKRAEDEVRDGKAFAAFPYATTEERKKEFDFSDSMYVVKGRLFYNKKFHPDGMPFEKLEDLHGYKIGGMLGSWYEPYFKAAGLQVEYVPDMAQNVEKLALGRIDLMAEEENTCWYLIRQKYPNEVEQFATLEKPLEQPGLVNDFSLMVSRSYPNSAEILKRFNAGLAVIRTNGIYQKILEKYQIAIQE